MEMNSFLLVACLYKIVLCVYALPHIKNDTWQLRILHNNDMHSRFEQTNRLSSECSLKLAEKKHCYGGFARIATVVRKARTNTKIPTLFLNAGDTYQDTPWFQVHKWKIVSTFLNLLQPDAISLGNHEFDLGPKGLLPLLKKATFPVVASNLDLSNEPELAASNISKSIILNVNGRKIGIIGYLTPETKYISQTGKVVFLDEIDAIRKEVNNLQTQGVNILIALGHSGFATDKKIAAEVEGLDLVIGGHTNTFLYSGKKPDVERPEGLYPTKIIQKSGRKVYVVQAYAYTKYLGDLAIVFDENGEIRKIAGNPILLDYKIEQAKDVLDELDKWRPALDKLRKKKLGFTKILLNGNSKDCRVKECNFGNLVTDAMVEHNLKQFHGKHKWTDASIAVHTSGALRTSISKQNNEPVTMSDVMAALPFQNGIGKVDVTGGQILQMLENSVAKINLNDIGGNTGQFLHFSGLKVTYNLRNPVGSRVVEKSVFVRCTKCKEPKYELLQRNEYYRVLMIDFMYQGGNEYGMFRNSTWIPLGVTTQQAVANYFETRRDFVYAFTEDRITFSNFAHTENIYNIDEDDEDEDDGDEDDDEDVSFESINKIYKIIPRFFK